MEQYLFHVRNGADYVQDKEGMNLPDPEAVRLEATLSAREFVADCISSGERFGQKQFEISNNSGALLAVAPFRTIIEID